MKFLIWINMMILITGVRFNKNFPITNMQDCAVNTFQHHGVFSTGEKDLNMLEDFWQVKVQQLPQGLLWGGLYLPSDQDLSLMRIGACVIFVLCYHIKLVSKTDLKFHNSGGCSLVSLEYLVLLPSSGCCIAVSLVACLFTNKSLDLG